MSLTVRSTLMKTLRSTLATTTVLLGGLVVSSHMLYPSDKASDAAERQSRVERIHAIAAQTRVAEAEASAPAWIDPPARQARADDRHLTTAWTAAPAPDVAEPAAVAKLASAQPERRQTAAADAVKKAEQQRRRRMAQAARVKQAKVSVPAANSDVAYRSEPAPSQRIDPIGDLLRGLGIGRQS